MILPVIIVVITIVSIFTTKPIELGSISINSTEVVNLQLSNGTADDSAETAVSDNLAVSVNNIPDSDVILKYTDNIDDSYLSKCVFLGDSRIVGMALSGYIPEPQALAKIGITHIGAMSDTYRTTGEHTYTFTSYLDSHQASVIYICYGVNGLDWLDKSTSHNQYGRLIDLVKSHCPNSKLVLMSIWPVEDDGAYSKTIQNSMINEYNDFLLSLAEEKNIYYLNVNEILIAPDGSMVNTYNSGDGLHYNNKGNEAIIDYVLHHPVTDYNTGGNLNYFPSETFVRSTNNGRSYDSIVIDAVNNGELFDSEAEAEGEELSEEELLLLEQQRLEEEQRLLEEQQLLEEQEQEEEENQEENDNPEEESEY